jgi:hypothetical protein
MAREFDDTNHFALFPNDRMRNGKNDPSLSGFINIDGQEYWFKGWEYFNDDGSLKCVSGVIGEEREALVKEAPAPKRRPAAPPKTAPKAQAKRGRH